MRFLYYVLIDHWTDANDNVIVCECDDQADPLDFQHYAKHHLKKSSVEEALRELICDDMQATELATKLMANKFSELVDDDALGWPRLYFDKVEIVQ